MIKLFKNYNPPLLIMSRKLYFTLLIVICSHAGFSQAMSVKHNQIELPHPWDVTRFWLIGCQFDLTLTNKVFFSTFFQYNEQLKNMNLNSRFQWRYAPASDLFIVYTDNYLPSPFMVRNRALVVKMTYWWNK